MPDSPVPIVPPAPPAGDPLKELGIPSLATILAGLGLTQTDLSPEAKVMGSMLVLVLTIGWRVSTHHAQRATQLAATRKDAEARAQAEQAERMERQKLRDRLLIRVAQDVECVCHLATQEALARGNPDPFSRSAKTDVTIKELEEALDAAAPETETGVFRRLLDSHR